MGFKEYAIGFTIGAVLFGGLSGRLPNWATAPKQVYFQKVDLNMDGVPDLVIEQNKGYEIPMYGVKEGDKTIYVPASKMMKRNPDSRIDYKAIEAKLNKHFFSLGFN